MTLSLAMVLAESARLHRERVALIQGDQQLTYPELWERARRHAAALRELGIREGDRVAIVAPNVIGFVESYFGVLAAGAVVVPIPLLLVPDEATYLISHAKAKLVLCHVSQLPLGAPAAKAAGVELRTLGPATPEHPSLTELAAATDPLPTFRTRAAEDPAVVFYTSGTTGRPKGAVLTHLNLVMNATVAAFDVDKLAAGEVILGCLPLFHIFGQSSAMNSGFRVGATLLLQPRFDAAEALELMRQHQVSIFLGVPTMYLRLLEVSEGQAEVPQLRGCTSGGAPLPVAVLEAFQERFGTEILEGYGLSETSPTATVNQPVFGARPGTVGHPIWGVEVAVVDPAIDERNEFLPAGQSGEIVIRGHNVFAGYLDDPAATEAAVVDGWFRTGDIGVKDAEGYLSVVDRKKDLIIRSGFNVYPREVEEMLIRHPAIAEVSVIGLPDERSGEEVCAVVVPKPGQQVTQDEVIAWTRERLGHHKYPRRVVVVDELPVGPSHKVLKRELRQWVATGKVK
ncbi:long-chain fatty acid--CoA ligase [Crossiella sp. CA-258035]|uniref:long-chain-fatty-acid--CoA ligase n=1 Tax=Crossiella sp. CA-258035 TaxID=2981138 RepID=UPI0024BD1E82|nr:long-chain fatty acid--CoA ligase [Crossiella sp. CA-258035]WHT19141.1 long-chain fatty acid--CoA ligase [Crossiella sp. CA-258035]